MRQSRQKKRDTGCVSLLLDFRNTPYLVGAAVLLLELVVLWPLVVEDADASLLSPFLQQPLPFAQASFFSLEQFSFLPLQHFPSHAKDDPAIKRAPTNNAIFFILLSFEFLLNQI